MKTWLPKTFFLICFIFLSLQSIPGMAQTNYPTRPITLLVGLPPGGNTDIGLRLLVESASKTLGQPIVLDNKTGSTGFLAFLSAINAKPDGYTIADLNPNKFDVSVMFEEVPHKVEDTTVIGCYWSIVHGLAARADAPWNTLKELVEYTRTHPGVVTYAVPGAGSPPHLAMIMLAKKEKLNWKAVPYKGLADSIPPVLGGHVTLISGLSGVALEHVKAGKMKLIVGIGSAKLPDFPDTPTLMDLGYDIAVSLEVGLVGPKGIPAPVLQKLGDAFTKASKEEKFQKFLKDNNLVSTYMNSEQFTQYLKRNYDMRVSIITELGLAFKK